MTEVRLAACERRATLASSRDGLFVALKPHLLPMLNPNVSFFRACAWRTAALAVLALALTAASNSLAADAGKATIRIAAGAFQAFTDAEGRQWQPDQGFDGGDVIGRGDIDIANTKIPELYRNEHYSMTGFKQKLPNGKYTVKLHFAETFEEISGPGQRVFSFTVEGKEFKDFDVAAKAGGVRKAHVETVEVEVSDGQLDISFESKVENPEINGIEIIPAG